MPRRRAPRPRKADNHGGTVAAPPPIGRCRGVFETREAGRPLHYTRTATRDESARRNTNKKTTDGPNLCIPHRRRAKRLFAELQEGGARIVVLVTWSAIGCRCCEYTSRGAEVVRKGCAVPKGCDTRQPVHSIHRRRRCGSGAESAVRMGAHSAMVSYALTVRIHWLTTL